MIKKILLSLLFFMLSIYINLYIDNHNYNFHTIHNHDDNSHYHEDYNHSHDKKYLLSLRLTILIAGIIIIVFAIRSTSSIYEMVGDAYKITLVTAVSPMFGAMFWKRATSFGAYMSVIPSLIVWISLEKLKAPQPQLFGFFTSAISMILFSYTSKKKDAKIYLPIIKPGKY